MLTFARQLTALDGISGGRLVLGLGAGSASFDATVTPRPPTPCPAPLDAVAAGVLPGAR